MEGLLVCFRSSLRIDGVAVLRTPSEVCGIISRLLLSSGDYSKQFKNAYGMTHSWVRLNRIRLLLLFVGGHDVV
jgi:hypothetical protein